MRIQLWRNATLKLTINGINFLIDPMLGEKDSLGEFPWTEDGKLNPLVSLPFTRDELKKELVDIDAVVVSHLHPDHWDEAAMELLNKSIPIFCAEAIVPPIKSAGFTDVRGINNTLTFNEVDICLTPGKHGTGEIGKKMGIVNGFIFKHLHHRIYIAGDTIWYPELEDVIQKYQPQHIVVAGGAATFSMGEAVTMTSNHIKDLATFAPTSSVWITHLEAVSPCKENRHQVRKSLNSAGLEQQCFVLEDGEQVSLIGE